MGHTLADTDVGLWLSASQSFVVTMRYQETTFETTSCHVSWLGEGPCAIYS